MDSTVRARKQVVINEQDSQMQYDKQPEKRRAEPGFFYGTLIFYGLLPPTLVLLAFGGRPAIIVLCFGAIISYIFDLLGSLEATMVAIAVTLIGLWGTMVWAARFLLRDSFLNIALIFLLVVTLLFIFISVAGHFRGLLLELDAVFYLLEAIIIPNMPLICSSLLTWFLCVEVPALDLSICFSTCYFVYLIIYGSPKIPSSDLLSSDGGRERFIISKSLVKALYVIPIVVSLAMHLALHHNVLDSTWHRFLGIVVSINYPALLMVSAAESQLGYYNLSERTEIASQLSATKLFLALTLVICLKNHPLLDEVKVFSVVPEPFSSYLLSAALVCGFAAVHIHRESRKSATASLPMGDVLMERASDVFVVNPVVSGLVAAAATALCVLLGMPWHKAPLCVVGAVCLAEFYQRPRTRVVSIVLVVSAAASAAIAAFHICNKTLWHLTFSMTWHNDVELTLKWLCILTTVLCVVAVVLPALAPTAKLDSNLAGTPTSLSTAGVYDGLFSFLLVAFAAVAAALELMLRDQDWQEAGVQTDSVYPPYLLGCSALLFLVTAMHLLSIGVIGISSLLGVSLVQSCKLLPMVGIPSDIAASSVCLLLVLALPFVRHTSIGLRKMKVSVDSTEALTTSTPEASETELIGYWVLVGLVLWLSGDGIWRSVLYVCLDRYPDDVQCVAAAIAVFFSFAAFLEMVFRPKASAARSVMLMFAAFFVLIATEALGISLDYDESSPLHFSLSFTTASTSDAGIDTSGLYLILSALLMIAAAANVFPVRKPLPRLLFALLFSFCSSEALQGWAFPQRAGLVAGGWFTFAHLYCSATALLSTSTALHASSGASSSSGMGSWMFIVCVMTPLVGAIWLLFEDQLEYLPGVLWAAAGGHACICVSIKVSALIKEILGSSRQRQGNQRNRDTINSSEELTVCAMAAVGGICWAALATSVSPHSLADLYVPIFSLLLLCTKTGLLVSDRHPWSIVALFCTTWWLASAIYAVFLRRDDAKMISSGFKIGSFMDADVSLWSSGDTFLPWITIALALTPLPAVLLSYFRRKDEDEDLIMVCTCLSLLAVIGGQVWSVRFLGLTGVIFGIWRCRDMGMFAKKSDRTI